MELVVLINALFQLTEYVFCFEEFRDVSIYLPKHMKTIIIM